MNDQSIALIGPGVMAEAIINGLIRQKVVAPNQIIAAGPRPERGRELTERYGIRFTTDNTEAARSADIVILSVKPQRLEAVLIGLRDQIRPEALVLSIVAGAPIQKIARTLNHPIIVRAMPNTPAQIGQGITVWTASPSVSGAQLEMAKQILGALGQEVFVEEENYLDMATALSGTGPAYVFLFMEALIDAGVHLGFPRRIAEQLVVQTLRGSVEYYALRRAHPASLRNEVTSPGGTSAAALYYLEKAGFRTAISRAVWAAYERSQQLGRGKNSQPPENGEPKEQT
ncbi:pyrroline-5-carboxylate reductase [Thermanaerothrix sp. 4228-RoL]|uniref:Pyrroline-5-carboxylate reductase n=1 Tax=Thermanaerothrix solaris TaxID=3058434 RepID=A0ABU3NQS6_9CHLR|nr:pyrroline-5-carboxylate reductase [Thermanaerothrix sp. 4228-RoL]MDT8899182.1 pyrroline-5-carboxylate reductase [Thermanaerothrix sp. 4228-RoL]